MYAVCSTSAELIKFVLVHEPGMSLKSAHMLSHLSLAVTSLRSVDSQRLQDITNRINHGVLYGVLGEAKY